MTRATDELQRMLDERGVEYERIVLSGWSVVWWKDANGVTWRAHDNEGDGLLSLYAYGSITSEQAIAATLGRGTCQMEYVERPTKSTLDAMGVYFCSECGSPTYNDCMPRYCIYCGAEVSA